MTATTHDSDRPFVKMHGLRNHFVIVDARDNRYAPSTDEIVRVCDVEVGIGADQLVVIEPSSEATAFMRLYNVDGREVEACGNATRCVAWLLLEEGHDDRVTVETLAGVLECRRTGDRQVSCDMGPVRLAWDGAEHVDLTEGPLADPVAVDVGNPHVVFFVDDVDRIDIEAAAPAIQADPRFPDQVNVGVAQVLDDGRIRLAVFERGAGLTTACGSGACAAAFAARRRGLITAGEVVVEMPAGSVDIRIDAADRATMSGPVAFCFEGTLP